MKLDVDDCFGNVVIYQAVLRQDGFVDIDVGLMFQATLILSIRRDGIP